MSDPELARIRAKYGPPDGQWQIDCEEHLFIRYTAVKGQATIYADSLKSLEQGMTDIDQGRNGH